MAATSRKIFLTAYNSLKGQQKTVQKLLSLIRAFKRLQEPLLLWSPHMLHTLRGTVYRALAQGGGIEWLGIQLSIFLSVFFPKASEQFPAVNKHAQRSNRLRAGERSAQKPVRR